MAIIAILSRADCPLPARFAASCAAETQQVEKETGQNNVTELTPHIVQQYRIRQREFMLLSTT
jgi:hypothetical protein